ncbi:MAG: hypothetical protein WCB92_31900 [Mycobacterium sp.]
MLGTPFTGVGRIHPDDRDVTAGGHRGESGTEAGSGDGGHGAAEPFAAVAAAHRVAPGSAGIGEVEVLDHQRGAPSARSAIQQGGDRRAEAPITAGSGQSRGVDGDGQRIPDGIAGPVEHTAGQVIGIEINTEHRADL